MTHGVDGFDPKVIRRLELRHHGPCHIHQRPVLPLRNTVLLRGVRCGIFMLDPLITKKLIQGVVLELGAIVTSYCQDLCIMLALSFICKVDDGLLSLTLPLEEVYPSVSLIIIHNHQAILSTPKTIKGWGPKEVHVKELQGSLRVDDSRGRVSRLMKLSFDTSIARTIFGKTNIR